MEDSGARSRKNCIRSSHIREPHRVLRNQLNEESSLAGGGRPGEERGNQLRDDGEEDMKGRTNGERRDRERERKRERAGCQVGERRWGE